MPPHYKHVIEFLTQLYNDSLSYSAINTARSALSHLGFTDKNTVGTHPLVIKFLKGVYNLRPPVAWYEGIWDVNKVLVYLRKLSPVKYLSRKDLSLKLVMLLALTTAARCQTLHSLNIACMKKGKSSYTFWINKLPKQSRPGYKFPNIKCDAYPVDRRLCLVTVLTEYLQRTKLNIKKGEGGEKPTPT